MTDIEGPIQTKTPKFKVGDRVTRPCDVYDPLSKLMHGTVVRAYSRMGTKHGDYNELYDVYWDELWDKLDATGQGYLPHGLDKA
jgi:hypothetical protein